MNKFWILVFFSMIAFHSWGETPPLPIQRIERYLLKAEENGYSGSVLISLNGKILLKDAYGMADRENKVPFNSDTVFDIGSITKQFTAACILKLESQGKLSVQDRITKFLTAVPNDKKEITIHHLLTHTAGLADGLGPDEELVGKEEYMKRALSSELIHPPGTYDYSNVGYSLLAAIVETASEQEYEQYLRENILKPAGMNQTGYVLPAWDKTRLAIGYQEGERWGTTFEQSQYEKGVTWHLKGNGGIHSTTGDMHLWYLALSGNSILNAAAKEKYFAPHVKVDGEEFYGYGWSVQQNQRKEKVIAHNGGNGYFMATMAMIPEKNFDIVVSTNDAGKNTDIIAARISRILFENLEELDEAFVKTYTGTYEMPSGVSLPVSFNENDEAVLLLNHREPWILFGGSESDDSKRAEHFDQKSRTLIQAILDGKTDEVASVSGFDPEEAAEMTDGFRARLEQQNGKCKTFDVLGSVSRRNGSFYLSPVRFNCDNETAHRLIIWQEERIFDVRPLPDGNTKNFEHTKGNEFFAETNNRTIHFDQSKGIPVLKVKLAGKEVIARKKATP